MTSEIEIVFRFSSTDGLQLLFITVVYINRDLFFITWTFLKMFNNVLSIFTYVLSHAFLRVKPENN